MTSPPHRSEAQSWGPLEGGSASVQAGIDWPAIADAWLTRAHLPLPEAPSLDAFARLAARLEQSDEPWVAWHDAARGATYLAGGALLSRALPREAAFQEAARLGSAIRERVVVEPRAAGRLGSLPLLWHGFAFAAGSWGAAHEFVSERAPWPAGEVRLPAWLLYREPSGAGLVVHTWGPSHRPSEGLVHARLNEATRELLRGLDGALGPPGQEAALQAEPAEEARFTGRVAAARDALRAGRGRKVVLSRRARARSLRSVYDAAATWRALSDEPGTRAFAWSRGAEGTLVGASPELLLALRAQTTETEALAGTAPLAAAEGLLQDAKNLHEHALVIEAIEEALGGLGLTRGATGLRRLRRIVHLQTSLQTPRRPEHDLLRLADALHPTPALGGCPRAFALEWLAREARGWFGAPLGFSDQGGGGEFLVTIRSALLRGPVAELFAGAGIVAESEPAAEWRETELKLQAAAGALRTRPARGLAPRELSPEDAGGAS